MVVVDPHPVYPPDLRCEKLDREQVAVLRRTGLADIVLAAATHDRECWVARFGRVVEKRPGDQYGILYVDLVNTMRAAIAAPASLLVGKVVAVDNAGDRQAVTLSGGRTLRARLVIVANGLNSGLRGAIGMSREDISRCHSITLAFNLAPAERKAFEFGALTYYGERTSDRAAYITLFPIGRAMRANLFVYRPLGDPWLRQVRDDPDAALAALMPGLSRVTGPAHVASPVIVRPADLYLTRDYLQPGIVLVGDAFGTSCPAAGTGADKVLTDVERLCNVYIPRWMATPGMGVDKIARFYADPVKQDCDRRSFREAFHQRSLAIDDGWSWRAERWARFLARATIGTARSAWRWLPVRGDLVPPTGESHEPR